jgi:hypothetical protein
VSVVRAHLCRDGSVRVKAKGRIPSRRLAQDRLAPSPDAGRGVGADPVSMVLGRLVLHVLRGLHEEVAVLLNRAAPDRKVVAAEHHECGLRSRGALDDDEVGSFQAPGIGVVGVRADRGPGGAAQAARTAPGSRPVRQHRTDPPGGHPRPKAGSPRCS